MLSNTIVFLATACGAGAVCAQPPARQEPRLDGPKLESPQAPRAGSSWKPTAKWKIGRPAPKANPQMGAKTARPASTAIDSGADESSTEPPASVDSNVPRTVVQPPGRTTAAAPPAKVVPVDAGGCDYWIASSRGCDGSSAPADACRCLCFFHRTSEKDLVRQPGEAFMASIRPDVPICFVVHGSYNRWGDVVTESRKIHRWLRNACPECPLQVVFFTWPSDGNMPYLLPVDIAVLGRRSAAHGIYLARLITQLNPEQQVSIVGHSHGARGTLAALHLLGGGRLEEGQVLTDIGTVPKHIRVVLIAAAVDHDWLNPGQRYDRALIVPERVLLLRNSKDGWLTAYQARKVIGERALGKDGLSREDRMALGSLGGKIVDLNAAEFADWRHSFEEFHQRPELGRAMVPFVHFQEEHAAQPPNQAILRKEPAPRLPVESP